MTSLLQNDFCKDFISLYSIEGPICLLTYFCSVKEWLEGIHEFTL